VPSERVTLTSRCSDREGGGTDETSKQRVEISGIHVAPDIKKKKGVRFTPHLETSLAGGKERGGEESVSSHSSAQESRVHEGWGGGRMR